MSGFDTEKLRCTCGTKFGFHWDLNKHQENGVCTDVETYTQLKPAVAHQVKGRSWLDSALKRSNQKLYPFYVFTNFNGIDCSETLACDYCGDEFEPGNDAGYFTAYFIFEGVDDVRLCCNAFHCRKTTGRMYDYHMQIHGHPEPIFLPKHLGEIDEYFAVFQCLLGRGHFARSYKLQDYVNEPNGIPMEDFKELVHTLGEGRTFSEWSTPEGESYWSSWDNRRLLISSDYGKDKSKARVNITAARARQITNEILAANRAERQLVLF